MELMAHERMQKGLEQIQQAQDKEAQEKEKVRKVDKRNTKSAEEKEEEVIDTYETIRVSKPADSIKEKRTEEKMMETRDPDYYGIMRIFTNPNREDDEIDESEEEMFRRFEEEIEKEVAEREHLGKKVSKVEPIKVCRCQNKGERETETRCDNDIFVANTAHKPENRIRRVQEKARKKKNKRPVDINSEELVSWDK